MAAKDDGSENILHNGKKHCSRWFSLISIEISARSSILTVFYK
jgi:hypothetical protein